MLNKNKNSIENIIRKKTFLAILPARGNSKESKIKIYLNLKKNL